MNTYTQFYTSYFFNCICIDTGVGTSLSQKKNCTRYDLKFLIVEARKSSNSIITITKSTTLSIPQKEGSKTLRKLNEELECNLDSHEVDKEPAKKKSKIK